MQFWIFQLIDCFICRDEQKRNEFPIWNHWFWFTSVCCGFLVSHRFCLRHVLYLWFSGFQKLSQSVHLVSQSGQSQCQFYRVTVGFIHVHTRSFGCSKWKWLMPQPRILINKLLLLSSPQTNEWDRGFQSKRLRRMGTTSPPSLLRTTTPFSIRWTWRFVTSLQFNFIQPLNLHSTSRIACLVAGIRKDIVSVNQLIHFFFPETCFTTWS